MVGTDSHARLLFQAAIVLFAVTIVIGILNGMGVWDPPHNLLMTHVHAGTLGWITLAVVAASILMLGTRGSDADAQSAGRVAMATIAATVAYVLAFATTTSIVRPIMGTLMLVAIVWVLIWSWSRYRASDRTTAQLGVLLALVSLAIGAVLGVLYGLLLARGSLPGLDLETARAVATAHPPSMLIGYLILAGAAIAHWLLGGPQSRPGRMVMWALFIAGLVVNIAFIMDIEELIQLATLLEVAAIITFIVHLRSRLAPSAWSGGDPDNYARVAVVFLGIGIALLVYVVQLFVSGELNPETGEGPIGVLLAFDHAMFIGVMTNVLFALVARHAGARANPVTIWGVNAGLVLFLAGLVADVAILKQIGAPIMGLMLLHGIAVLFLGLRRNEPAVAAG